MAVWLKKTTSKQRGKENIHSLQKRENEKKNPKILWPLPDMQVSTFCPAHTLFSSFTKQEAKPLEMETFRTAISL